MDSSSVAKPVESRLVAEVRDAGERQWASGAPERRLANNGRPYTRSEFHEWYGDAGERHWANASEVRLANDGRLYTRSEFRDFYGDEEERHWTNAGWQLVDGDEEERHEANFGRQLVDAPQLAVTARLKPEHVIPIQQEDCTWTSEIIAQACQRRSQ